MGNEVPRSRGSQCQQANPRLPRKYGFNNLQLTNYVVIILKETLGSIALIYTSSIKETLGPIALIYTSHEFSLLSP